MGIGILPITRCFNEARILRHLPPEHRIVGHREDNWDHKFLIEGPLMPESDQTEQVSLFLTMTEEQDGRHSLTGQIAYRGDRPPSDPWVIGSWPSTAAYQEEMDRLYGG